jgi:hypothetical protein
MNVSTLWRELEKRMSEDIALDGVDPLHVIEWAMRYFFGWRRPGVKLSVKVSEKSIERHDGVDCQTEIAWIGSCEVGVLGRNLIKIV